MNQKIFDLIKQATKVYPPDWNTTESLEEFDKLKFAELIVRECADVVLKWKSEPFPYDPEFGAKIIKEHFGIEDSKGWVCPLCDTDRTRAACPKGHSAAITGECPMVVEAQ